MTAETPPWLLVMRSITGMSETPGDADNEKIVAMADEIGRRYPDMQRYADTYQHDETPWCGLTVAYCMAMCDIRPVFGPTDTDRWLWAQAWDDPSFGKILDEPRVGCVVVMTREGGGHVTLYERTEGSTYVCRGGNQSDAVKTSSYSISDVIALVWPNEGGEIPDAPRPTLEIGDTGADVESVQTSLGIPADGEFGAITEVAVEAYQAATGLESDGVVGPDTWEKLDKLDARMAAGSDGLEPASLRDPIMAAVSSSALARYSWNDRGVAPEGYLQGMALTFALAVQEWMAGNEFAIEIAKAATDNEDDDALAWYADEFEALGMSNDIDGLDTLRHLFVLLIGLGQRESSGEYFCGRDMSADNVSSDTAEAGLFQTSWNIKSCSPLMGDLADAYWSDPNGWLPVFAQGLYPTASGLECYGSGEGAAYQWLAKFSPSFAALVTALGLRKRRSHWGPINGRDAELRPEAEALLLQVQELVTDVPMPGPEPEPVPTLDIVSTGVTVSVNGRVVAP